MNPNEASCIPTSTITCIAPYHCALKGKIIPALKEFVTAEESVSRVEQDHGGSWLQELDNATKELVDLRSPAVTGGGGEMSENVGGGAGRGGSGAREGSGQTGGRSFLTPVRKKPRHG